MVGGSSSTAHGGIPQEVGGRWAVGVRRLVEAVAPGVARRRVVAAARGTGPVGAEAGGAAVAVALAAPAAQQASREQDGC